MKNDAKNNVRERTEENERKYRDMFVKRLTEQEQFEMGAVSPYPPLGACLENDNNVEIQQKKTDNMKEEKTYIENGYAYVLQKQRNDGYLYNSGVCLSESLAYEMRENEECDYVEAVPIFGSEQDKELLDKLKNPPQSTAFDDNFAKEIAEAGIKAAKTTHEFKMQEIKAQMLSDLCNTIIQQSTVWDKDFVARQANEIVEMTLGKL